MPVLPRRRVPAALVTSAMAVTILAAPALTSTASAGGNVIVGAFVQGKAGTGRPTQEGDLASRQKMTMMETSGELGAKFKIDHQYRRAFREDLITDREQWDKSTGRTPFVNFAYPSGCDSGCNADAKGLWRRIAGGEFDGWLNRQRSLITSFGRPIYLGFQHEPERRNTGNWMGTPADFQAAWRHIYSKLETGSNTRFIWTLVETSFKNGLADQFWPGGQYVDVVGVTGYNWACSARTGTGPTCGNQWREFSSIFHHANSWASNKGESWWVAETGLAEDPARPGRKADWINKMRAQAKSWPRLTGIIFFFGGNRSAELFDYDTSSTAKAAYRGLMQDGWFARTP